MNDFLLLQRAITAGLCADPTLCLAYAVSWLDPLWRDDEEEIDLVAANGQDVVYVALYILRRTFPDIYLDALRALREGRSCQQVDHLVCAAIQKQGIPLDSIEWIAYGIPLPAYGVSLDDPDFYTTHPEAVPVLDCFGVSPEPNPYDIIIPEVTYKVAEIIADDLLKREDDWRRVGWVIEWLFGLCGNTVISLDDEMMSELQPLSWDADDIALATAIIEEADGIMDDVRAGLAWLNRQPAARLATLAQNVQKVYRMKGKKNARYQFEWPCATERDE